MRTAGDRRGLPGRPLALPQPQAWTEISRVNWFAALTTAPGQERAERLAAALERMQPRPDAVVFSEIEDGAGIWEVGGYFGAKPESAGLALLAAAFGAREFAVSELPDVDWVDKVSRQLAPVRAGRFVVHGSHSDIAAAQAEIPVLIEASLAFGTGHHATTTGCLETLDALCRQDIEVQTAADIGCGTGVLAIAMAKLWRCSVCASDNDPTAVEIAQRNSAANQVSGQVKCFVADGLCHREYEESGFDLIAANILSEPLKSLAPSVTRCLRSKGHLVLSGIVAEQAASVISAYRACGIGCIRELFQDSWATLLFCKN